ncbi:MAG: flagellar biosynthesis protein FlhF, partial [Pirellulales bacterium]|nr:flagellar biosynthesis protein FlhF [Pirellulales bacterium]
MEVKTYRASSMHDALMLVRHELGPDAAVLHTREVRQRRCFGLLAGRQEIEVTASAGVNVPSRLPQTAAKAAAPVAAPRSVAPAPPRVATHGRLESQLEHLQGMVRDLCRQSNDREHFDLPDVLFRLFTDLIEADVNEKLAREMVEQLRAQTPDAELSDPVMVKARMTRLLEEQIPVAGPITVTPGTSRVVALVGPTGVGKTTTIAKLAANHRLKMRQKVGLITVDTYRIAAVEQLRTYADIIDLPMQVVSTPREMREAVRRLAGLDLILMDTAGRSPRDDIRIQELKAFLNEAGADEVH